ANPSKAEAFEFDSGPKRVKVAVGVSGGNDPIGIILTANAPQATLGAPNFDLELGKGADLENARPSRGYESEAMRGEDGFEIIAVIAIMTTARNRELERKTGYREHPDHNIQNGYTHLIFRLKS
nr:hypothetical protein [Desulfobacterales bacterium]